METDTRLTGELALTCARDDLSAGLGVVTRALSTRGSVQVLSGVELRAEGGTLRLAATDMELSLRASLPAEFACLKTSPVRSTPGPLPYHMPNTPSRVAPGHRLICCVPHTDVAARSSLTPGWKTMSLACRCFFAFHSD